MSVWPFDDEAVTWLIDATAGRSPELVPAVCWYSAST
jgi:hypothetical protein